MLAIENNFDNDLKKIIDFVESNNDFISYESFISEKKYEISNLGIIYFIYVTQEKGLPKLVYIGKSKGAHFKKRITDHLHHVSDSTNSKLHLISKEREMGNTITFKFVTTSPESYRNSLEENLIDTFKKKHTLWNIQKGK